jgi:hypothetical protein
MLLSVVAGCFVLVACTSAEETDPSAASSQGTELPSPSEESPIVTTAIPEPAVATTPTEMAPDPLGSLSPERNIVEHGPDEDALTHILETAPFFEQDVIRVTEGGEALLDFGDQILMRLFNDTELQMVSAEIAEEVPLGVQVFLFVGGFTGQLTEEGSRAVYETPGGVEITVLGTDFFVVYDAETELTTVGNFGGTVEVASAGSEVSLEDGSQVTVPAGSPPGPPMPLPLSLEAFEDQAREAESPIQAASQTREWSLEIRHEFTHEYGNNWDWVEGLPTFLRLWTGQFTLEGDQIVGSGTGLIDDVNLKCINFSDPADIKRIEFSIEGSFDFDIDGQLVTGEDGRPAFMFEITASNLMTNSLSWVYDVGGNCDFLSEFFLDNNRTILEDLPLLDAEAIIVEAAQGAQTVFQLDPTPYDKYKPGEDPWTYKDIYFKYPIEVSVGPGQ